jgi:hypothetical protein
MRENKQQIEQLLKSYAERTGFPLDELNRLKAERQAERHRLVTTKANTAAQVTNEEEAAFVHAVTSQHDTFRLLTTSSVITLSEPNTITLQHSNPNKEVGFDTHLEAFNSSARITVDQHTGNDSIQVSFQFRWENPNQSVAVINIGTLLRFTGFIEAISDTQIFDGDPVGIELDATLEVIRGSGWGVGPDGHDLAGTSVPIMGNIYQQVGLVVAVGGGLFGNEDLREIDYAARPIGLGTDFVVIPGGASVLINPSLNLQYFVLDDGDVDDINHVIIDFSYGQFNRGVMCPFAHVEVLT